jgi:cytidylate kinase
MKRIDQLVDQRRTSVTATSKNAIVEELLAIALDKLNVQLQQNLPGIK